MVSDTVAETVKGWIESAISLVVLTGAGISAESGVPTFRGDQGLWQNFRAEDLANPQAFARDPELVWQWYDWRRTLIAEKHPNPAHSALARLERRCENFTLITQNVDGLHDLAGSRRILKLHGDIWNLRCTACQFRETNREVPLNPLPPRCECGALLRPDIVWFGEMLPEKILQEAWRASGSAPLMLVIGTSALVQPAASLPLLALESGARVVEINPEPTALTPRADAVLDESAASVLPRLID